MRPAYRTALIVAALATAMIVGLSLLSATPDTHTRGSERLEPLALPEGELPVGAGEGEKVESALDRLEAAEVQRFGEAEASRRRRLREQLVHKRVSPDEQ